MIDQQTDRRTGPVIEIRFLQTASKKQHSRINQFQFQFLLVPYPLGALEKKNKTFIHTKISNISNWTDVYHTMH